MKKQFRKTAPFKPLASGESLHLGCLEVEVDASDFKAAFIAALSRGEQAEPEQAMHDAAVACGLLTTLEQTPPEDDDEAGWFLATGLTAAVGPIVSTGRVAGVIPGAAMKWLQAFYDGLGVGADYVVSRDLGLLYAGPNNSLLYEARMRTSPSSNGKLRATIEYRIRSSRLPAITPRRILNRVRPSVLLGAVVMIVAVVVYYFPPIVQARHNRGIQIQLEALSEEIASMNAECRAKQTLR